MLETNYMEKPFHNVCNSQTLNINQNQLHTYFAIYGIDTDVKQLFCFKFFFNYYIYFVYQPQGLIVLPKRSR